MKTLVLLAVLVVSAACGTRASEITDKSGAAPAALAAADSAAIVALNDRLAADARVGKWDDWSAEYSADPVRLPPNSPAVAGKAAVDAFNHSFPKFPTFDLTVTSVVGRGDLAAATGTFKFSAPAGKDSAGKATPAMNDEGKFMQILTKQADGSWKIARDIWNSNLPVPVAASQMTK